MFVQTVTILSTMFGGRSVFAISGYFEVICIPLSHGEYLYAK